MIKVLIVDDHEILRRGLSLVFELEDGFELVGEACNGDEAILKTKEADPDIVLMDIRMPEKNGIEAAREIKQRWPDKKVMMLTAIDNIDDIVTAIDCGVEGYALKSISGGELVDAVHYILSGKTYLHPFIARRAVERLKERNANGVPSTLLTPRESMVLCLMGEGRKNKEIAGQLFLSEETVKTHVSHILMKLHQADRMQAVLYAICNNLITLEKTDYEN